MPDQMSDKNSTWPLTITFGTLKTPNGELIKSIAHNWIQHIFEEKGVEGEQPVERETIIVKLTSPAPRNINAGRKVSLKRELFIPFFIPVNLDIQPIREITFTELRGPNLKLPSAERTGRPTEYKTLDDLTSTGTVRNRVLDHYISGSNIIDSNLDYIKFENFVHFSSAQERLKTFKYKIEQINYFESKSAGVSSDLTGLAQAGATSSFWLQENKVKYDQAISDIKSNFADSVAAQIV